MKLAGKKYRTYKSTMKRRMEEETTAAKTAQHISDEEQMEEITDFTEWRRLWPSAC